ncbi:MAG: spoIIIJ-associated protein [Actinomycetota bacterium]|nr:spoIIIJ-associated protein [Actinomycetota bacterium]
MTDPITPAPSDRFPEASNSQEDLPVASTTDKPLDVDESASSSLVVDSSLDADTDPDAAELAGDDAPGDDVVSDEAVGDDAVGNDAVGDETAAAKPKLSLADLLEREGEVAADYLEGLLDIVDSDGDIDMDVEGDRAVVSIIGDRLRHLVGPDGNVLDALQELTRLAVARETGVRSRLMLDIGGHRARRRADLTVIGTKATEEAIATGEPVRLTAMSAFERKVVHDAVAAAGLRSESEGVEPQRFVVVLPDRAQPAPIEGGGDDLEDAPVDQA